MLCSLLSVCLVLVQVPRLGALLSALRIVPFSGSLSNITKGKVEKWRVRWKTKGTKAKSSIL